MRNWVVLVANLTTGLGFVVAAKRISQDIGGYVVPDDVKRLVRVLVGILE